MDVEGVPVVDIEPARIGVIGGSGLYVMEDLTDRKEVNLTTPFGDPSAAYVIGNLDGKRVAFLARHGVGHHLQPSELNYRANIFGFKILGVEWLSLPALSEVCRRGIDRWTLLCQTSFSIALEVGLARSLEMASSRTLHLRIRFVTR